MAQAKDFVVKRLDESSTININVVVSIQMVMRVYMAKQLFRLAAWILGCGIEINEQQSSE